jgi:hypothetical protein
VARDLIRHTKRARVARVVKDLHSIIIPNQRQVKNLVDGPLQHMSSPNLTTTMESRARVARDLVHHTIQVARMAKVVRDRLHHMVGMLNTMSMSLNLAGLRQKQ